MFSRLPDHIIGSVDANDAQSGARSDRCSVSIDGRTIDARNGDTVAATMLAAGFDACRVTAVAGVARGPYCMMGVCFDCLAVIDGHPNQQGCMIAVRDGMRIETQRGARGVDVAHVVDVVDVVAGVDVIVGADPTASSTPRSITGSDT